MFLLVGLVILFGSILGGYTMHGGKVAALMQYTEFLIIGGSALGSVVIGYSPKGALQTFKGVLETLKGNPFKKETYLELLNAMYEVFMVARKNGFLELEKHVEHPEESDILKKYPGFLKRPHAVALFADTLKLVAMGGISTYNLSDMMDLDLEAQHEESMKVTHILSTVADSLPGFGIVAAVLGVVISMQAIGGPPEQIGEKVGAALVGTFLGILMAYGIVAPLAKSTESVAQADGQYMACVKHAIVAFARGDVPLICVEFARRNIDPEVRPTFEEMEQSCKQNARADGGKEETAKAA